jgi:signal transduction histidine kinase
MEPILVRIVTKGLSSFLWMHSVPSGSPESAGTLFMAVDLTTHIAGSEPLQRMIGQLAHDLRSPLTSISGAAELLLSGRVGELPGVQEKLVKIVDDGASRMADIIQNASDEGKEGGAAA